jgi:dTDP-4-amino-4,6-dideoxygalactose transaminase
MQPDRARKSRLLHQNAIPVFVDAGWDTMVIDPVCIEAAIAPD